MFVVVWSLSRVLLFCYRGCQAPLSMGFPRQECWSGLPFPFPGDLSDPGIEPMSPAFQVDALPLSHQGSLNINYKVFFFFLRAPSKRNKFLIISITHGLEIFRNSDDKNLFWNFGCISDLSPWALNTCFIMSNQL